MNKDPLDDIPDADAMRLTACADAIDKARRDFPGTDPHHLPGFTEMDMIEAKAMLKRLESEPVAVKAKRKHRH